MHPDQRRWLVLLAGICSNLCQGSAYAFSVYAKPLMGFLGCDKVAIGWAFTINVGFLAIGTIVAGKLADSKGPRIVVLVGGLIFGCGLLLAGLGVKSLLWIYLTYGLMLSLASGAAYGATVGASVKWFPDKRGLASGIVVAALGFGPVIIAPVAQKLISLYGILATFQIFGVVFMVVICAASWFITSPPKDYVPTGFVPKVPQGGTPAVNMTWTQMLGQGRFWLLYVLYVCGAFSGLLIISQMKPFAVELAKLDDMKAALVVSILAAANASGRVVWGAVSDRIGRYLSLVFMFLITAVAMFLMTKFAGSSSTLIPLVVFIGLCYGGYLGLFPSMCADAFGPKNLTLNYGLLFSAFSIAGALGPYVGAKFAKEPNTAFVIAGIICCFGLVLALLGNKFVKKTA